MIQRRGGAPGAANHEEVSRAIIYKALVDRRPLAAGR
jgi:hypothetical protein